MPAPVIDFHVHVNEPEAYARGADHNVMSGFGTRRFPRAKPGDGWRYEIQEKVMSAALQIADMDKFGIGKQLISLTAVSCNTDWAEPEEAAALNRRANERIAEWVRANPQRFIGSFTLPLQDMKLAMREMTYAVETLGLKVANMSSNCRGEYLGEARFRPFWEAVEAQDLAVFIHPHGTADRSLQKYFLWNGVGQPFEETRVMASLMHEGVLDAYPGLKIVMAHGGGYLPHYIGRLDRNFENSEATRANMKRKPSEYLRNFYYDTCVYGPDVLEALIKRVGADRIVFGTDYPVGERDPFATLNGCAVLSGADRDMITRATPAKILGLEG